MIKMENKNYDYYKQMEQDIKDFFNDVYMNEIHDEDDTEIDRDVFIDSVIVSDYLGSGTGSYTLSTYIAKQNVLANIDLAIEIYEELGYNSLEDFSNWELTDLTIREYLVTEIVDDVVDFENAKLK